jgi:hypothetical protein
MGPGGREREEVILVERMRNIAVRWNARSDIFLPCLLTSASLKVTSI